jgi:RHS repeat-associated protein
VSFAYDGNGLRQSETNGSTTTHFTWSIEGALPVLLSDGANSYIYGPSGIPVEQISSSGTPTYLLADQLGSTRALTNSSGSVTATFSYDPWGNLIGSTGSATTPFMYAGQYYDTTTGLYYLQARYYDPANGQFLSVDPAVSATESPYGYVNNNPTNATDPNGAWCVNLGIAHIGTSCPTKAQELENAFLKLQKQLCSESYTTPQVQVYTQNLLPDLVEFLECTGDVGGAVAAVLYGCLGNAVGEKLIEQLDQQNSQGALLALSLDIDPVAALFSELSTLFTKVDNILVVTAESLNALGIPIKVGNGPLDWVIIPRSWSKH